MKDIIIPVSLPDDVQGPEWENEAIEYAKQALEERLRAEFEKERRKKNPIWDDIESIEGVWIDGSSNICQHISLNPTNGLYSGLDKNVFLTEKHAKAALAIAQISQLMPYYGGEVTDKEWHEYDKAKYVIVRGGHELVRRIGYTNYEFVAFRTEEDRTRFMSREENMRLVRDYFMMD